VREQEIDPVEPSEVPALAERLELVLDHVPHDSVQEARHALAGEAGLDLAHREVE
jgi:hypothetical protein